MKGIFISALMGLGAVTFALGQDGGNERSADRTLRGSGRVNASTLGMEFDLPLGSYPGRGINVPISLSYSSKVWRMKNVGSTEGGIVSGGCRSLNEATYSENSASGWTTSLATPYVEYVGYDNQFTDRGFPLDDGLCVNAPPPENNLAAYIRRLTIHLPSGETHELRADDTPVVWERSSQCPPATYGCDYNMPGLQANWNRTYYAVDGSNIKYVEDSTTSPATYRLLMPDGSFYDFEGARTTIYGTTARKALKFTDRNGNFTSFEPSTGAWTDTLGKTINTPISPTAPSTPTAAGSPIEYEMPGMTGKYKFHWKRLKGDSAAESGLTVFSEALKYPGDAINQITNGNWNWRPSGTFLFGSEVTTAYVLSGQDLFNPIVLTEIELPTGQKYKFSYNIYGLIEHITYPTGGSEKFVHGVVAPLTQSFESYVSDQTNFGVTNRKVYETAGQGTPYEWSYSAIHVAPSGYKVSVVSPDDTISQRFLHQGNGPCLGCDLGTFGYDTGLAGMPYKEATFDSAENLVAMSLKHWTKKSFSSGGIGIADWHPRITHEETYTYDPNGSGDALSATVKYEYEGNLDLRETPVMVNKTTQYAFVPLEGGGSLAPINPDEQPEPNPTPVPTPIPPTPVKIVETTYLINDPNYAAVKSYYTAQNMMGLVTASTVKDGAGTVVSRSEMVYDESGRSPGYRGNPTTSKVWDSTKGVVTNTSAYISTSDRFDSYGNQYEATDAEGNTTTTAFDSTHNAFPVTVTSVIPDPTGLNGSSTPFVTTTTYNYTTGLPLTTTDANGLRTEIDYDAATLRPRYTRTFYGSTPVGSDAETIYHDESNNYWVKNRAQIDENKWTESITYFNGLGRRWKSEQVDSGGNIFVEKEFDADGRVSRVTNPFRANETKIWTTNVYDEASRIKEVVTPDGAKIITNYGVAVTGNQVGTVVTVTDQAGKVKRSISDVLAQLRRADEPDSEGQIGDVANPNLPIVYNYDTLGNLTTVTHGVQSRLFAYSSLSRLISMTNPESGTVNYNYDNSGNMIQKTDARGIQTVSVYDALDRLTHKSYSAPVGLPNYQATPEIAYFYDNLVNAKGKLIKVRTGTISNPVSITEYQSFNELGRVMESLQTTEGITYGPMTYTYNNSGALIEQAYPSGRIVKNSVDNNGKLTNVQSKKSQNHGFLSYAEHLTYNSAGAVTSMQLGNGRWESTHYNSRLQPTQVSLGTVQQAADQLKLEYSYGSWENGNLITSRNNGNLAQQIITVPSVGQNPGFTAVQTYYYDSLNRIDDVTETVSGNQTWRQDFSYDRYGNRNLVEANTTTLPKNCGTSPNFTVCQDDVPKVNPSVSIGNNRPNGYTFDNAGNMTEDAEGRTFIYDAENKQVKAVDSQGQTIGEYFYDGNRNRIKKISNTEAVIFIYDASGKLVSEYSQQPSQTPQVGYVTGDYLGSPRITTNENGDVTARHDYHPFGEEIISPQRSPALGYIDDSVRQKFTAYENDVETNLSFAKARYLSSTIGRFQSPDPYNIVAEIESARDDNERGRILRRYLSQPQNWNRYSYVLNNPVVLVDPDGELWLQVGPNSVQWVDECPKGSTCYVLLVFSDERGIRVFGTSGPNDITDYYANKNGQIDLNELAKHHNANFIVAKDQNIAEEFLSKAAAASLFRVAYAYSLCWANDSKLEFTAGNLASGKGCVYADGSSCHKSHNGGNAIDIRYMDTNGKAIGQGNNWNASEKADVYRMRDLIRLFNNDGFNTTLTGNQSRYGLSPKPTLEGIHKNHIHFANNGASTVPRN